jgi:hypothetical protein
LCAIVSRVENEVEWSPGCRARTQTSDKTDPIIRIRKRGFLVNLSGASSSLLFEVEVASAKTDFFIHIGARRPSGAGSLLPNAKARYALDARVGLQFNAKMSPRIDTLWYIKIVFIFSLGDYRLAQVWCRSVGTGK